MTSKSIRRIILDQAKQANVGHIGSALCIADIIAALYGSVLKIDDPDDYDRDRFILSKGHAALALYAAIYLRGWISDEQITSYCKDGTHLGTHPDRILRGVDFSTGSLGLGISMAVGAALAARMQKSARNTYVLVSDAECNEGSLWESVMFASQHSLGNLFAIVDCNGQQALDYTDNVIDLSPMEEKWRAFGWDTHVVDGHNVEQIISTLRTASDNSRAPHVLVAKTVFGKGVSFMENKIKWHYMPMSDEEYRQSISDIETGTN
jgi:transketolase